MPAAPGLLLYVSQATDLLHAQIRSATCHEELRSALLKLATVEQADNAVPDSFVEAVAHPALLEAHVHLGPRPEPAPPGHVDCGVRLCALSTCLYKHGLLA